MIIPLLLAASSLLVGGTYSRGLGEHPFAPIAEVRLDSAAWRLSALGEWSHKLESGQGYILALEGERSIGPMILAGKAQYRNGGPWVKKSVWVGLGVGNRSARLLVRHELPTADYLNDVWSLGATISGRRFEWQSAAYNYRMTFGTERRFGMSQALCFKIGGR